MKVNRAMSLTRSVRAKVLVSAGLWLASSSAAYAQSSGGGNNLEPLAQAILDLLTGNVARIFAAIAVVLVGYLYWAGKGSAQLLFTVIIGCFFVFSARWIVDQVIQ